LFSDTLFSVHRATVLMYSRGGSNKILADNFFILLTAALYIFGDPQKRSQSRWLRTQSLMYQEEGGWVKMTFLHSNLYTQIHET